MVTTYISFQRLAGTMFLPTGVGKRMDFDFASSNPTWKL